MAALRKSGLGLNLLNSFKKSNSYSGKTIPEKDGWWYSNFTDSVEYWETNEITRKVVFKQYHISPSITDRDIYLYFKARLKKVPFDIHKIYPKISDT